MFQNYMDDLSQFCLVPVLIGTWTICHTFILDDLSQVIFVLDDMSKKERSGYGADRSQLSFS